MLKPYDIEIMPCTFFQQPFQQEPNAIFPRKRTNTVEHRSASKIISSMTSEQLHLAAPPLSIHNSHKLKPKWIGESQTNDTEELVMIPKKTYEYLLEQVKSKDERILELEEQLNAQILKNDETHNIVSHLLSAQNYSDTTRLRQVIDYNNVKQKKIIKK